MASTMSSDASESPVLSVISKRIRALRKKHNRIIQMEESVSQGKTLNKEQEETLRSKPYVLAAIDELEKIKQPISVAISEEISTALREKQLNTPATNSSSENIENPEVSEAEEPEKPPAAESGGNEGNLSAVRDLLNLLYFGSMFDVKNQNDFTATMLTRTHERGRCLTYDYVTDDDAAELLGETDLDMISMLGGLLISRAVDSSLSHKDALERCLDHAKLWIENSDHQVVPGSNISYAELRQKLNKIMATEYFTATPGIKAPGEVAGYGSFQVPVHGPVVQFSMQSQVEVPQVQYELQEAEAANNQGNGSYDGQSSAVDESHQGDEEENYSEFHGQAEQVEQQPEIEPTSEQFDKEPHHVARKSNQNRGGRGGGGGRRGYSNGRGGRGSSRGGAYTNGRNQYYEQGGGYYPRNNYYRGRGGRGGAGNNNYQVGEGGYLVAN